MTTSATGLHSQLSLSTLNQAPQAEFASALAAIYEHSPWIPSRAWEQRPFSSIAQLHAAMMTVLKNASDDEKLGLICAHPELAGKEAQLNTLTEDSKKEQRGAGLDQCTAEELQLLRTLNRDYRETFGFPFIVAVKGLTRDDILAAIAKRISNSRAEEFDRCLNEINKIALFRLQALIADPS